MGEIRGSGHFPTLMEVCQHSSNKYYLSSVGLFTFSGVGTNGPNSESPAPITTYRLLQTLSRAQIWVVDVQLSEIS